jgi:hypothetical protein
MNRRSKAPWTPAEESLLRLIVFELSTLLALLAFMAN